MEEADSTDNHVVFGADPDEDVQEQQHDDEQKEVSTAVVPEPESPANKEEVVQAVRNRGKRAQTSRRVKLPGENTKPQSQSPTQTQQKAPAHKPAAVTVIFKSDDKSKDVDTDEEEYTDDEGGHSEPSKIVSVMGSLLDRLLNCLKLMWSGSVRLCCAAYKALRCHVLPWLTQLLFPCCLYLMACHFLAIPDEQEMQQQQSRMNYVLSSSVWALLPIALVGLVSRWDGHALHRRFLQASTGPSVLLLVSCMLLTTQITSDQLVWLRALLITVGLFRSLHWISLTSKLDRFQSMCRPPTEAINALMLMYAAWLLVRHDLGCFDLVATETEQPVEVVADAPEHLERPGWF